MTANKTKVTILDIARLAKVSPSTVSRVLRNSATVSEEKEQAVLAAVAALDYKPNVFAQSLASGQSMTIGVLTQNFGSPFYDAILQGIILGLEGTDYWPLFADGRWQPAVEERALQLLLDRQVDGLIVIGGQLSEERIRKVNEQTTVLIVARELESLPAHSLHVDNLRAGYEATRYLLQMGHRDIAHITVPASYHVVVNDVQQRYEGYKQALREAGLALDPTLVVEGNLQQSSGVLAVERLMGRQRPFSAIFAANDQMAFGARLALYRRGIRVPDDISLVGFDDEPFAAYMVPPLTSVRQPAVEMGRTAAVSILELIKGKPIKNQVYVAELITRESVARPRMQ